MSRAVAVGINSIFGAVFVGGLVLVWSGLQALVFGSGGRSDGIITLAGGFAVWTALAAIGCRVSRP